MSSIYHLAPAARWRTWPDHQGYLPAEYDADGFVHCTSGDDLMLQVANRFYKGQPGDYVLLVIDSERLESDLRWEQSTDGLAALFPHIYGPINRDSIIAVRSVRRADDGEFLGW